MSIAIKIALPLVFICSCGILAKQPELRLAVPLLIGVTACMTMVLAFILYHGASATNLWQPSVIIAIAFVLRLLFLFNPPQLSDDIYRYLWDGNNLLRGVNPYAAAPAATSPAPEMATIHSRINHPRYVTIYPPAAQLVFAAGAALGGTITGFKIVLVLLDVGLCALILLLLQRLDMPPWRSVLYAWNPLPILEIAGSGHVDGAGLTMLFASIYLLSANRQSISGDVPRRGPYLFSGVLLACSSLVKLYPLVFIPVLFFLIPKGRRRHFFLGFITAFAILPLLFMPHVTNMTASLETYARTWEFAGFAFTTLRGISGSGSTARIFLSGCGILAVAAITIRMSGGMKNAVSSGGKERHVMKACYAVAMTLLLLTPTLQPWYALSLAVFLPFCAGPAGLILCWVVLLTYQVQISYFIMGRWNENPWVTSAVFLAPLAAYLLGKIPGAMRPAATV